MLSPNSPVTARNASWARAASSPRSAVAEETLDLSVLAKEIACSPRVVDTRSSPSDRVEFKMPKRFSTWSVFCSTALSIDVIASSVCSVIDAACCSTFWSEFSTADEIVLIEPLAMDEIAFAFSSSEFAFSFRRLPSFSSLLIKATEILLDSRSSAPERASVIVSIALVIRFAPSPEMVSIAFVRSDRVCSRRSMLRFAIESSSFARSCRALSSFAIFSVAIFCIVSARNWIDISRDWIPSLVIVSSESVVRFTDPSMASIVILLRLSIFSVRSWMEASSALIEDWAVLAKALVFSSKVAPSLSTDSCVILAMFCVRWSKLFSSWLILSCATVLIASVRERIDTLISSTALLMLWSSVDCEDVSVSLKSTRLRVISAVIPFVWPSIVAEPSASVLLRFSTPVVIAISTAILLAMKLSSIWLTALSAAFLSVSAWPLNLSTPVSMMFVRLKLLAVSVSLTSATPSLTVVLNAAVRWSSVAASFSMLSAKLVLTSLLAASICSPTKPDLRSISITASSALVLRDWRNAAPFSSNVAFIELMTSLRPCSIARCPIESESLISELRADKASFSCRVRSLMVSFSRSAVESSVLTRVSKSDSNSLLCKTNWELIIFNRLSISPEISFPDVRKLFKRFSEFCSKRLWMEWVMSVVRSCSVAECVSINCATVSPERAIRMAISSPACPNSSLSSSRAPTIDVRKRSA